MSSNPCRTLNARRWYALLACTTLLAIFLFPVLASAQVLYGTLTGNVTDQSGAAIPKADIEALNVGTGVAAKVSTDATGNYRFNALQAGTYKVTVNASGFAPKVFDGVDVGVNLVRRVDAQLGVASQQQTVEVTGEAPILQTDKADVHTDLTARQVSEMPIMSSQGRNFQSLLRIIPGVSQTAETNSLAANPNRSINANVNGQSIQTTNTRIDGAQDSYPWLPANVAYVPPADAIETVNVVTNSFDAEQGMAGAAAVNVQIKSGTNAFHGAGFWYHFDQNFAARNYFNTDLKLNPHKPRNNQNQFGGVIGGPIIKNKLFFFGDYQRTTQRNKAGPVGVVLPIPQMVNGDFRGITVKNSAGQDVQVPIFDPATGNSHGNGKQIVSCNGVQYVICPTRFDPAAAKLIQLIQPYISQEITTTPGQTNYSATNTALFNRDDYDIKINYNPTDKTTAFGRFSSTRSLAFDPPVLGSAGGGSTGGGQLGDAPGRIYSIGLGATHAFNPSVLFDWNFGYTRQRIGATFDLDKARGLDELGVPGTNGAGLPGNSKLYNGLPAFAVTGMLTFGNNNTGNPFLFRDNQFVSGANVSWTKGRHAFRYGVEWNHAQINHFQPQGGIFQTPRGTIQFNGTVTGGDRGAQPNFATAWADFLLGLSSQTGKAGQLADPIALRWNQWAWYIRDQWQITPKLTATVGVRWEFYPFGYSDNGKGLKYLDLNTGNVLIGGYGSVPRNDGIDVGKGQFLPRLGLAYRLTENTVVRGGYGWSNDPNNWRQFRNSYPAALISTNPACPVPGALCASGDAIPAASLTGKNATGLGSGSYSVPVGIVNLPVPDLSSGSIPLALSASTFTIPNPFHRGYIESYNLLVQHDWKGIVLETGYVGAYGVRPMVNMNVNAAAPGTGTAGGLLSQKVGKNYTGNINAYVPFKNSNYNSLQTKLTRRWKQGTMAGVSWTWSKSEDYASNEDLGSMRFPYPASWNKSHAVSDFDRTHNVKVYGMFVPPFGKGQRWAQSGVASAILGGWQITPIITRLTGLPFTVGAGGALNANGYGQVADLIGKFRIVGGRPPRGGTTCAQNDLTCHYFDPSAFAAPLIVTNADAHLGNTNRNEFRGPGYFQMDLSLAREFPITERVKLQFRAEAFSLTNTPHFGNPQLTCPGAANVAGPVAGSGQLCGTGSNNNFGVITGTLSPPGEGFFGNDPGNRSIWLAARVTF